MFDAHIESVLRQNYKKIPQPKPSRSADTIYRIILLTLRANQKEYFAMWRVYALLSALFAALTAIFAKVGVKNVNSDLATAIRTTIILILTWGIAIFGQHVKEIKDVSRNTWVFLILSGVATGLSWLFYFKAIQLGDVSKVAPIDKLSVVITIILAFIFLREQVDVKVIVGALLITAGSVLMLMK